MPRSQKISRMEKLQRLEYITSLIVNGMENGADLVRHLQEKKQWSVSERQLCNYIADCYRKLEEAAKPEFARNYSIQKKRLLNIYKLAMVERNFELALRTLRELNQIEGLYKSTEDGRRRKVPQSLTDWIQLEKDEQARIE